MVRFKKRYLLCEIVYGDGRWCERSLNRQEVYNCVKAAIQLSHGDYGTGVLQLSLTIKHFNVHTSMVIIRAQRGFHKLLMSALAFVKRIGKYEACFRTLHLSGTIRSCHKFLVKYHRQQLPALLAQCRTEDERKKIKEIIRKTDHRQTFGLVPRRGALPCEREET